MLKQQIINKVKEIILTYAKPERIYIYGSQINGEAKKGSDIDIAYDDKTFKDDIKIDDQVEKIDTLIKIDVKNIAFTQDRFKNRVKSTGKVIYSATKKLRVEDGLYNFSNALKRFASAVDSRQSLIDEGFEDMYLDLIVKRFEFTFEMSWKTMKRYLDFLGFEVKSPRASIKEAFSQDLIDDESIWLDMIEQRNITSHVYDEYQIEEIIDKVEAYKKAFLKLKEKLESSI